MNPMLIRYMLEKCYAVCMIIQQDEVLYFVNAIMVLENIYIKKFERNACV